MKYTLLFVFKNVNLKTNFQMIYNFVIQRSYAKGRIVYILAQSRSDKSRYETRGIDNIADNNVYLSGLRKTMFVQDLFEVSFTIFRLI